VIKDNKKREAELENNKAETLLKVRKQRLQEPVAGESFRKLSPDVPVHRIDAATGLPVYKAHLLKVGEGGGTSLCPFDCNCCF
jgi:hypothetical protein